MAGRPPPGNACALAALVRISALAARLRVAGTPTIVMADGWRIVGALPPAQLVAMIDQFGAPLRLIAGIKRRAADLPPWFANEAPSRSTLRLFRSPDEEILVLTRCDRANCDRERAYVGVNLKSGVWGGSAYLGRHVVELGSPIMPGAAQQIVPQDVVSALICAQNLDWGV